MPFAIKAQIDDPNRELFTFSRHKTMYGGKSIAVDDPVFVFSSENEGGQGLVARGVVVSCEPVPRLDDVARQTPRVSIVVRRIALASRTCGRRELKPFTTWDDGRPESELNFKLYRQATNKIVGISEEAAAFLGSFF